VSDPEPLLPEDAATVVSLDAWRGQIPQLAALLTASGRQAQGPRVIPNPAGSSTGSAQPADVADPGYWATDVAALADAMAQAAVPGTPAPTSHTTSGAVSTSRERLTLTVEEAAASLGISRASAYEAVRRGDIPAIRIGRRILVPRAALEKFLASALPSDPETDAE
jgi:excisionase family DNA binding protein